jgi:hypothetical protein
LSESRDPRPALTPINHFGHGAAAAAIIRWQKRDFTQAI